MLQLDEKPYKTLVKRAISTPGMSFLVPGITKTLIKHAQSVNFCQMAKPFKNLDKMCYLAQEDAILTTGFAENPYKIWPFGRVRAKLGRFPGFERIFINVF